MFFLMSSNSRTRGCSLSPYDSARLGRCFSIEKQRPNLALSYGDNEHPLVRELLDIKKNIARLNKLEAFHDALERKDDAHQMFTLGMMDLQDKAKIETLYW